MQKIRYYCSLKSNNTKNCEYLNCINKSRFSIKDKDKKLYYCTRHKEEYQNEYNL